MENDTVISLIGIMKNSSSSTVGTAHSASDEISIDVCF